MIQLNGQIFAADGVFSNQVQNYFFVSERQTVFPALGGFKLIHYFFNPRVAPAAGFVPNFFGVHQRHQNFLAADGVHFLAHNSFNFLLHPPA